MRHPGAAVAAACGVVVLLAACSSSAPATLATPSPSASLIDPAPSPSESLLETQLDEHSAAGELVEGFPEDLVPLPEGSEVLVSSAEPVEGSDLLAISLNLRSTQDAAGLLAAVAAPLVAAGFVQAAPPEAEPGLAAQATFSRSNGDELVVVGILDRDGVRTMTLGGQVRPAD